MTLTFDDLRYDPDAHRTLAPDGTDVPHVTTVLGAVGLSTDFAELGKISGKLAGDIDWARARGAAVHADCHAYDDGQLDVAAMHQDVAPYVHAWAQARRNLRLVPVARERRLFHPVHRYTGIMDGVFRKDGRALVLVDIKTGDPDDSAAHLQTAAYAAAYEWGQAGVPVIDERWAIWLQPGQLRVPYRVVNYTAAERHEHWLDFPVFSAALVTYNNQPGRRPRIA